MSQVFVHFLFSSSLSPTIALKEWLFKFFFKNFNFFFQNFNFFFFVSRKQVAASQIDAERDNVKVPTTMEEYCMKAKPPQSPQVKISFFDVSKIWYFEVLTSWSFDVCNWLFDDCRVECLTTVYDVYSWLFDVFTWCIDCYFSTFVVCLTVLRSPYVVD